MTSQELESMAATVFSIVDGCIPIRLSYSISLDNSLKQTFKIDEELILV
jgi:hypothetical protein